MKVNATFLAIAGMLTFGACQNTNNDQTATAQSASAPTTEFFVSTDTANKMIGSYLASIGDTAGQVDPDNLQSLILDADALREYLNDKSIKKVKIMFAHTLSYINSGHKGQPAGYQPGAFSIVVGGYNAEGNYVVAPGYLVPENAKPCPTNCPTVGTAAQPLLPTANN